VVTYQKFYENFMASCLYVLHVNLALPINAHGALRGRKVALFENQIKQNRVMEYQLIKLYQLNQEKYFKWLVF
jgi:hypothetical protein